MGQSIGLKVDPRSGDPIYRQIFDQVVTRIEGRAFPRGYRLPPARELARQLSTHRNTVARAYADLEAAGFVSSQVGRGTFVESAVGAGSRSSKPASEGGAMPWASLLARAARDGGARAERYARGTGGRDVVNLARMQPSNDLMPHDLLARCLDRTLADHRDTALSYAPHDGVLRLRQAIASELSSRGVPALADDLVVTSGSQQALDVIARALVNPGDAVLVDATTYSGALEVFSLAGARLVPVPSDGSGPEVAALQRLARPDVKALYLIPNGHNPTGLTMPVERRREIVAWSRGAGIPIIEDDYAAGLTLDDIEAPPFLRALDGDVLHVSTFSKRLIPALRVGYLVCPAALRTSLVPIKRVMDLGTSALLQHALAEFMERGYMRAHTSRIIAVYRERREALEGALHKHMPEGVRWNRPSHGVVCWLRLPPGIDPDELFEESLRQGVRISPSPLWSVDSRAEIGLRIAFCSEPADRIREGVRRLGKAITTLQSRGQRRPGTTASPLEVV